MTAIISRRHLSRRSFLRGVGASLSLPLFDAMLPAMARATEIKAAAPVRLGFVYVPNGIIMEDWTPKTEGAAFDTPYVLEPIAKLRDDIIVASRLAQLNAQALGDGGGDHARASAVFLTGVHPVKTGGADIRAAKSVDQIAAQHIGHLTRFPSLELTVEKGRLAGSCDTGYSCAYSHSISWRTDHTPNPPEANPRAVFDRLFGAETPALDAAGQERRKKYQGSILDFVLEDTHALQKKLGPTDRGKLDEYLHAVRSVERQLERNETQDADAANGLAVPESAPKDYGEYARLMYDLQVLAYQTEQTRVITFMMGLEGSNRAYREAGVSGGHHELSHHQRDAAKIAFLREINRYHMEQFAYFIDKMKNTPDGDGSLLDHALIVYGSGISDGDSHQHNDLPVLLAGHAGGAVHPGRHIRYGEDTPMSNLYLNMLEYAGCPTEKLGDSNGKLNYLDGMGA
ncbi:MAG: DUF1552 domain-containing protein [Candidatus Hydrogenedentes bacterium]|nr:DUF1552 domain-containing protein [Candidatus Hydrogenedentota bacterium]